MDANPETMTRTVIPAGKKLSEGGGRRKARATEVTRRPMMRLLALLTTAVALNAAPALAAAKPAPEPLPYTSVTPANGATMLAQGIYEGGFEPIRWTLVSIAGLNSVSVNIAATATVGKDGKTLSNVDRLQGLLLSETGANEGVYTGIDEAGVYSGWSTKPGTYYWQIEAETAAKRYLSPIFSLNVVPHTEPGSPAPPPSQLQPTPSGQPSSGPVRQATCGHGYTRASIGGRVKCLRAGQSCTWRYRHQYLRYHLACVRKSHAFRLVRRKA